MAIIRTGSSITCNYCTLSATIWLMGKEETWQNMNHPRQEVLVTRAIPPRSRVQGNLQARFCRPAEGVTLRAEFNDSPNPCGPVQSQPRRHPLWTNKRSRARPEKQRVKRAGQ